MARRRNVFNPLETTAAPRWRVIRNMTGKVLESRPLPAATDLKRLFVESILEMMNDGWEVGEFSTASGAFFCNRKMERLMVSIDPTDPNNVPMYGGAHLAGKGAIK